MKKILILITLTYFIPASLIAQEFIPIIEDYNCARLSNGSQYLVSKNSSGYSLVSTKEVKDRFNKQRRLYVQRSKILGEVINNFKKSRIAKSKLINNMNGALKKLFNESGFPQTLPPDEAEQKALDTRNRIQAEISILDTVKQLIDECESGINPKKGKGTTISPTVEPIVVVTKNSIIGGAMITTSPLKVQFATKPGGYNACLKTIYPVSGFVGSVYVGMGDEDRCFAGNFGDVSEAVCNTLIPDGRVGVLVQMSTYAFVSLPDATTEQLVDRMRLELIPRLPVASVLAFIQNISRDAAAKQCETF